MRTPFLRLFLGFLAVVAALALPSAAPAATPKVLVVHFAADINPVTQDYLSHQLKRAGEGGYSAVVILLDTPGGLISSKDRIVVDELASRVPVVVYVSPRGGRAASAGVWVGQAADVLAMAPETNIGSSTPIDSGGKNIGSDLRRKLINDQAASLRGLAAIHGRNVKWADAAVRRASNLTADEALRNHVIDVVAPDLQTLLREIDGRVTKPRHFRLHTAGAQLVEVHPGFFTRFLNVLLDPNVISLLFLAGIAGLGFELFHPGVVIPGAFGGICLLLALFGFAVLPVSWAALGLVLLGIALLIVDLHVLSHGALTLSGLVSLIVGLVLLFHNAPAPYQVNIWLVAGLGTAIAGFWAFVLGKGLAARRRPVEVGTHTLVGAIGEVRRDGLVFVNGELWQARAAGGEPLQAGEHVRVDGLEGLVLTVRPVREPATVS